MLSVYHSLFSTVRLCFFEPAFRLISASLNDHAQRPRLFIVSLFNTSLFIETRLEIYFSSQILLLISVSPQIMARGSQLTKFIVSLSSTSLFSTLLFISVFSSRRLDYAQRPNLLLRLDSSLTP